LPQRSHGVPDPWSSDPGSFPPMGAGAPVLDAPPTYGSVPTGPAPRTGPPDRRPPQPRGSVAAIVVLAVLLVVALIALGLSRRTNDVAVAPSPSTTTPPKGTTTTGPGSTPSTPGGGGGGATPGPSTPPSTAPASSSGLPTGPSPSPAEVQARVDLLVPFVEQRRGVTFTTKPPVVLVPDTDFAAKLTAALEPERPVVERRSALLQAMAVVANGVDLVEARNQILANETVAFYDPATKSVLVRALPLTSLTDAQLVRELTRAIDDQVAGLARPQYATDPSEHAFTFAAVVAGDAARIRDAWVATLPSDQQASYTALVQQVQSKSRPAGMNAAIIDLVDGPATVGLPFVQQVVTKAPDRFATLFTTPPTSTAQLLHVDRFLAGDEPEAVDPPDAEGDVVDQGAFGEQLTALVLADSIAPAIAREAADGWKGDAYVRWQSGGAGSCVRIHYVMDSLDEAQQLYDAFTAWARTRGGAEVDAGSGKVPELQITSCGGNGGGRSPL
jgi:hypothetical protein